MASRALVRPKTVADKLALFNAADEWSLADFCEVKLQRTDQWGRRHLTGSTPGQRPTDSDQDATLTVANGVQVPVYRDHNRNWRVARRQYEAAVANHEARG